MASATHSDRHTETDYSTRYWMAQDPTPLWPFGWVLIGLLVLLFLWGLFVTTPDIESDVNAEVQSRIERTMLDRGWEVSSITTSGQNASVELSVANAERAAESSLSMNTLNHVAESARCDTLFGRLVCPVTVTVSRDDSGLTTPSTITDNTPSETAPVATWKHHNFSVKAAKGRRAHVLSVSGEVPDQATEDELVGRGKRAYGATEFDLTITAETAGPNYSAAYDAALALLQPLTRGEARWENGQLSLTGLASESNLALVQQQFASLDIPTDQFDISIEASVAACNAELAKLMEGSTINFNSGSANISDDALQLLDALAQAASTCPGTLIIEGHTDSSGNATANQNLSEARAGAVRRALISRGLAAARLRAVGYGASQPIATNTTPTGRAMNRRIIIEVDEAAPAS